MAWEGGNWWQGHQWVGEHDCLCKKWHPPSRWDGNNLCLTNDINTTVGHLNPVSSPQYTSSAVFGLPRHNQCPRLRKTEKLTRQGENGSLEGYQSLEKPDLAEVSGSPPGSETLDRTQFKKHILLLVKVLCCLLVTTGRRSRPTSGSWLHTTQRIS